MSIDRFRQKLGAARTGEKDRVWFPRWVRRFAAFQAGSQQVDPADGPFVELDSVIAFLQSLRDAGVPAWQRLQATRALERYRDLVLESDQPDLSRVRTTLSRIVDRDRAQRDQDRGVPLTSVDEQDLTGVIDPNEPVIVQRIRRELRLRHMALETERAYVGWIRRFITFCGSDQLEQFGEVQMKEFLTGLAVEGAVTAGTQDQAKCALLFLYQRVLGRELQFLDVRSAQRSTRLPVVLSRQQIAGLLAEFRGVKRLMFLLMYGSGLRHRDSGRTIRDPCRLRSA